MANTRDIKRRIKSVANTQQITRAMKMVSAAKLRRSQAAVLSVRPFTYRIEQLILHVSGSLEHPYLQQLREVSRVCYVVIGFDQGLCGGFSANLDHFISRVLAEEERPYDLLVIGWQQQDYCRRQGLAFSDDHLTLSDAPRPDEARALAKLLRERYDSGRYDEINMIYSHFVSSLAQEEVCERLLPIPHPLSREDEETLYREGKHIFEPSAEEVLTAMLPYYVDVVVYCAMQESKASEHGARMTAMSSATENAADMLDGLTLSLNRARQGAITTEISEIVGGANALRTSRNGG